MTITAEDVAFYLERRGERTDAALVRSLERIRVIFDKAIDSAGGVAYDSPEDSVGYRPCCGVVSYEDHNADCWVSVGKAALDAHRKEFGS